MTFFVTLVFIAISLLSVDVLPDGLQDIHILQILGGLLIFSILPGLSESGVFEVADTYLVTGVLAAGTLSIVATGWLGGAFTIFLDFLPIILVFYFIVVGFNRLSRLKSLVYVLCAVCLFIILQGYLAESSGDLLSPYLLREAEVYRHRGLGVLGDPNDFAQLLVTVLPLLWIRWKKGSTAANFFLTLVPAAILVIGIYQTKSRGGIIALIAVMLFGFKDKLGLARSIIITGIGSLGLLAFNFSGGRAMNQDDGERINLWSQALTAFKSHPIFGVGVGRFPDYNDLGLTAHNSYVLCLAELGLFGYFFWMGNISASWGGLSLLRPKKKKKSDDDEIEEVLEPQASLPIFQPAAPAQFKMPERWGAYESAGKAGAPAGFDEDDDQLESEEDLRHAGKMIQAAFVGLLVAGFFISRTYSMIFYILFGMSAVVQLMYRKIHPEAKFQTPQLIKRIVITCALTVVGIYLFIRIQGVH